MNASRPAADLTPAEADVSVVICSHSDRRFHSLERAVEALRGQTLAPKEIVLVVDHEPELLRRARTRWPDLRVIANTHARGLSGARNSGGEASTGSVIAFLDDDAVPAPDWLARMTDAHAAGGVIAVGGAVDPLWLEPRPRWFPKEFDWVVGCSYAGLPEERAAVRNPIGASMSLPREVFEEVGGFRDHLGRLGSAPFGCEETELCIRARRRWQERVVVYDPAIRAWHLVPPERARRGYFLKRCWAEGRSKARVARLAGSGSLGTELGYSGRVLPGAVLRELRDAVLRRDLGGVARAGAIVSGFAATLAGFLAGCLRR